MGVLVVEEFERHCNQNIAFIPLGSSDTSVWAAPRVS